MFGVEFFSLAFNLIGRKMAALPRQLPFDNDISIDPKKLFELVSLGTSTEIELPARLNAWRHV